MTVTLIVLAHPNRASFNGAWAEATATACEALGHEVIWSDLVALGFDAVEGAGHYNGAAAFDPLKAQEMAAQQGSVPTDVAREIAKIQQADRIVFHFPMWWFAPPAVLKGWFDRVLMHGALHTVDERFDRGRCRGKAALFCVTTGATDIESGPDGKEGNVDMLLWPTAYTLRYLGMAVLEPVVVHGVHGYHEGAGKAALEQRLAGVLGGQADVMSGFDAHVRMRFNADVDFDEDGRLRGASVTPFIRPR
ncbi:NAD(P)H-dependent oxidoreductase [Shimia abyssi]|uniref:NAD(P)H dehydrogenase (Quinone) n=1 Tax=Shimia abyssi TaxID=1662395 RepID=A0A2P8F969_9RHOB|nr:NAD(P)H-dependent oxidoreductase [Shimia abyssi]PSL18212.1 NAD(P)H dehydrogenase (quinone) [Shimia abyssi]